MVNFRRILMIGLAIVLTPVALCHVALYLYFDVPENNIRQSLELHPEATLVFEDRALYGSDVDQKSLYYWTALPIEDVQKHYEESFQPFMSSTDRNGNWLITGYHLDGLLETLNKNSSYLLHGSFCPDINDNRCVSIALADAKQADLYRLAVSSPSSFYRDVEPPEMANIPFRGTLIIYSYWADGF